MPTLHPSSATTGFFQSPPTVPPQYHFPSTTATSSADPALPRVLSLYLPSPLPTAITEDLTRFAQRVLSPALLALTASADTHPPTLHPLTTFGAPNTTDPLHTSAAWQALKDVGIQEGIVALGYDEGNDGLPEDGLAGARSPSTRGPSENNNNNRRIHQFAKYHLWTGSAALVTCPAAMTDGAAVLLGRHLSNKNGHPATATPTATATTPTPTTSGTSTTSEPVFREVRRRLLSRDPAQAWTSGQWMTERRGGSDVSGTETVAVRMLPEEAQAQGAEEDGVGMPLGDWRIDGFKWFSSATDADAAVLLARTAKDGLSAFYAPMKRRMRRNVERAGGGGGGGGGGVEGIESNGVRIQRLKNKMGTRALPTAELELHGMRAYLIGREGEGVKEISAVLNITRLHTAVSQVGYWGRGLAVSRAYSMVRKVGGGSLLANVRQHVRWMAHETVRYHAAMHLTYLVVALLGVSEQGLSVVEDTRVRDLMPRAAEDVELLLRVLTPLMKAQTALASIHGLRACLESLGGLGYLENNEDPVLNVARLFRDANVGAIWEGTTSVMADDLVRVLKGRSAESATRVLEAWIVRALRMATQALRAEREMVSQAWTSFRRRVQQTDVEQLQWKGRQILGELESVVCGCVLIFNAASDGDEVQIEIARRWVSKGKTELSSSDGWEEDAAMDRRIFLGDVPSLTAKL